MSKTVTVKRFSDESEAHIAKGFLESNGIKAFVFTAGGAYPQVSFAQGVALEVRESDFEAARNILDSSDNAKDS